MDATQENRQLNSKHLSDLRESGLNDEAIKVAGFFSASAEQTQEILGFAAGPGLSIPYPSANGEPPFTRVKPDSPFRDKTGRIAKYLTRKGAGNRLYIPHEALLDRATLTDSNIPLLITEGEKKAEKSVQEKFPCIAFAGVWAWRQNGKTIPDMDLFAWQGRRVHIAFDSDAANKPEVQKAEYALAAELRQRGATVHVVRLPGGPKGEKVGLDDYLVAYGPDALRKLLAASTPLPGPRTSWTAADLLLAEFPTPRWAVPGLIPVGLCSLAGRPKVGKSWLALQLAHAVGAGGQFLGQQVDKSTVLYLALEDGPRRLQARLRAQHVPETAAIYFETASPVLDTQGVEALDKRIDEDDITLVIVDTFSRAIGGADQMDGAAMTELLGRLQQMAQQREMTILLVDHHRKLPGLGHNFDPVEDLFGATSKAAIVDAAIGLYRERGRQGTILKVVGRDLEEKELSLHWNAAICTWENMGDAGAVRADSFQAEVLRAIGELTTLGELETVTRIAGHLGRVKGQVGKTMADLVNLGMVLKGEKKGSQQPYIIANTANTAKSASSEQ